MWKKEFFRILDRIGLNLLAINLKLSEIIDNYVTFKLSVKISTWYHNNWGLIDPERLESYCFNCAAEKRAFLGAFDILKAIFGLFWFILKQICLFCLFWI